MQEELAPVGRHVRRHAWRRGAAAAAAAAALLAGYLALRPSLWPATPACNFGGEDGHQHTTFLGRTLQDVGRHGSYAGGALVVAEVGPATASRYAYTGTERPANGPPRATVTPYAIRVVDRLRGQLRPSEAVLFGGRVGSCGQPAWPPPGLLPGRRALLILSPPRFQGATYQAEISEVLPIQDDEVFAYRGFWLSSDVPGRQRPGTYPAYDRFEPNHRPARGAWIPLSGIRALARR